MMFPASVPEIPAANVDKAAAYYVNTLGFTFDWGDDQGGIAGISRGNCRLFITNHSFRESYGNIGPILFWLNLDSKAEVDELFTQWKAAQAKIVSEPEDRGSCASLWPPILMATSFVSSMISGATCKKTTHCAKSPTDESQRVRLTKSVRSTRQVQRICRVSISIRTTRGAPWRFG
jgi:hypothetical protein